MTKATKDTVFKNTKAIAADRRDETTRASQAITGRQTLDRDAKTARLKAARLDKEALDREAGFKK